MKVTDSFFTVTNITQLLCYYEDLGPPSSVFPSGFPTNTLHATSIVYLIMYLPTIILWTVQYKTWHSSLYNSVQSPVTYSLIGPNISLSTVLSHVLPIMWETQSFTLTFLHSKCKYIWLPSIIVQRDTMVVDSGATQGYGTVLSHGQFPMSWEYIKCHSRLRHRVATWAVPNVLTLSCNTTLPYPRPESSETALSQPQMSYFCCIMSFFPPWFHSYLSVPFNSGGHF
jgi:hypothetical protein